MTSSRAIPTGSAHVAETGRARSWAFVFGLVVLAHGGLIALLGRAVTPTQPADEPAILIDMAPAPVPTPDMPQQTQEPDTPKASAPAQPDPPRPDSTPPPPEETLVPAQASPTEAVPPEPGLPDPPLAQPLPEVAKPPAVVPRHQPVTPHPKPASLVSPSRVISPSRASAQPALAVPQIASAETAPPTPATSAAPSSPPLSWQAQLIAHLNRFKRYPADAQIRQRQGTAVVQLRLLPNGSTEGVRLLSSSGTNALDEEAIALIGRAQPLPVPDRSARTIVIAVPIQFMIR